MAQHLGLADFRTDREGAAVKLLVAVLLAALNPLVVLAHEMRPAIGTATIQKDGSFAVVLSLNLEAIIAGVGPEHSDTGDSAQAPLYDELRALPPEVLREWFSAVAPRLERGVSLGPATPEAAPLTVVGVTIPPVGDLAGARISEVTLTGRFSPGTRDVLWSFDPDFGDSVIRLGMSGEEELFHSQYVSGGVSAPIPLDSSIERKVGSIFSEYLRLGFIHIVPKGLDHILFIVGLFLLSTRRSVLLWQITAFTLAHTITLALGTVGIVRLSPAIVEPLIALSIVYVAVENLVTTRLTPWRPLIVFGFGLLHGLGFAGVLGEIGLSTSSFVIGLVAFNIGVELGQLAVIAACFVLLGWAMRLPDYRRFIVRPGSVAIALVAAFWSVERALI